MSNPIDFRPFYPGQLHPGLLGNFSSTKHFPAFAHALAGSPRPGVGGTVGAYFGSRPFDPVVIKRFLTAVLLIAGIKLIRNQ